ncbi:unnamed protein product [Darwinula stevensoni]|uniref:Dolichyl-diphosphooligosaccharide--protein glycosyltransferase subunit 1 n=1 Tax=Darwinula stevensoni TaxID=69355 RepID=A0A7R8ZZT6_9CRUS|nr:unnamed protein product [Darwinula stevensoni]CAG0884410.1 unnamed protein product [Darwinula stevensoni]
MEGSKMMSQLVVIACCVAMVQLSLGENQYLSGVVISEVKRTIDLSSPVVKISLEFMVRNEGKNPLMKFPVSPEVEENHVAFIEAAQGDDSLIVHHPKERGSESFYILDLKKPVQPGDKVKVNVNMVLSHVLEPLPAEIKQTEKQLLQWKGNAYIYHPCQVETQTTKYILPSSQIEGYSRVKPVSSSDSTINYGPYENVPSLSKGEPVMIHYEYTQAVMTVTSMTRTIEVSHWGNIAVEEVIDILNTGARLKGPFSRPDLQKGLVRAAHLVAFKTVLPASSRHVYYRDEIGNISTSHLRELEDSVEVILRPRFPLFGGWKTHYLLGYSVPSYEYLFTSGEEFVLEMRLLDHVFDDVVVDDLKVVVILPEGSRVTEIITPYDASILPESLTFTYLDTEGRPTIAIHKSNLVENHIQNFQVHYTFPRWRLAVEPFLVVIAFYLLFLVVIIYVRLDFRITKDDVSEARMRASGYCEQIANLEEKREDVYQQIEAAIQTLKTSKDVSAFQASMKNLNNEHRIVTQNITDLIGKVKADSPDAVDRLSELQQLDKQMKELLTQQSQLAERLLAGKMNKQAYMDADAANSRKKEQVMERLRALLLTL